MSGRWFRMYDAVLDDPKVQRLHDSAFRAWVNLMCVASRNDGKISENIEDLSFALRKSEGKTRELLQVLISAGLIDPSESGFEPHNWRTRQFVSDDSSSRVRAYRERVKQAGGKVHGYLEFREAVIERDGNCCVYCGSTANIVLDHVVPVIQNGPGEPWNLAAACKACNSGKAGRDPFQAKMQFRTDRHREFCHAAVQRVTVTVTPPESEQIQSRTETEKKEDTPLRSVPPPAADPPKARKTRSEIEPEGFVEFYQAYPLHKARPAAAKAYGNALKRAPAAALLDGARRYAAARANEDPNFTKHPATWLNNDCWMDQEVSHETPIVRGRVRPASGQLTFVEAGASLIRELFADGGQAEGGNDNPAALEISRPLLSG